MSHLLIPVVTNASKSLLALRWVISETEERYRRFAGFGVRNLSGYNDSEKIPYKMPIRIQGAYVSDEEIVDVIEFLKNQSIATGTNNNIEKRNESSIGYDTYFAEVGRFLIDKDKATIGMIQRRFKIGFNRAVRIMDQLCRADVVGGEEGTKPREILMGIEEFEKLVQRMI